MTLTLTATQCFRWAHRLTTGHHSTTFSYNRLSGSENTGTKPGNTDSRMDGHTDEVVPIINNTLPDFVTGRERVGIRKP